MGDLLYYLDLFLPKFCTMLFFSETQLNDPQYCGDGLSFGNTAGNVGQQGINSGNAAVGHQWNGGHNDYGRRSGFYL